MAQTFMAAMKGYFGFKPGQGLKDFADEIKVLTYEEKCQFHQMLVGAGVDCNAPIPPDAPKAA